MSTTGFAIKKGGSIDVKTVSLTEQAAWINWLLVDCYFPVRDDAPIKLVREVWERFARERDATCIKVEIREVAP